EALAPSLGFSVTRPSCTTTGRIGVTVRAPPDFSMDSLAATSGATGAPLFSRITSALTSKRGGAGGGARRLTTGRSTASRRGSEVDAAAETRTEARSGMIGAGPATTASVAKRRITPASRTGLDWTGALDTKVFRATIVTYDLLT